MLVELLSILVQAAVLTLVAMAVGDFLLRVADRITRRRPRH